MELIEQKCGSNTIPKAGGCYDVRYTNKHKIKNGGIAIILSQI